MYRDLESVVGKCQNKHFENFVKLKKCEYLENYKCDSDGVLAQYYTQSSSTSHVQGFGIGLGKMSK